MARKYTSGVLLSSVVMFLLSILIFIWAPANLLTVEVGLMTIIAVTLLISWVFIPRNTYYVLTSLISALAVVEVLVFYPQYKTVTHVLFGIIAFITFLLSVLSVSKPKVPKTTSNNPYYESKPVQVEKKVVKKAVAKKATQPRLSFYDVKTKKKFTATNYRFKVINGRRFAIAKAPSDHDAYRVVGAVKTSKKTVAKKKAVTKKTVKKAPAKKATVKKTTKKVVKKAVAKKVTKKVVKKAVQPRLSFYDVKKKKKFTSTNYRFKVIKGRRYAIAKAPSNYDAYRLIGAVKTRNKAVAKKKVATKKTVKKAPVKKAVAKRNPAKKKVVAKKTTKKTVPTKKPVKKVVSKTQKKKSTEKLTTKDGRDIIININEG